MAGSFSPTGTYSNLTRLELEQLRRSDFAANRKALTVGDAASGAENIVGRGSLTAEPYTTGPSVRLADTYSLSAPDQPGPGLLTSAALGNLASETVRWFGPSAVYDSLASGYATDATHWKDDTLPVTFIALGVQAGDILLVKPTSTALTDQNANLAATITVVGASTLTLSNIWNPSTSTSNLDFGASDKFSYLIIRPTAAQLFAVPGSGPVGKEQTFLFVQPGSPIHNQIAPSAAAIEAARITDIVPPGTNSTIDRADFVYSLNPNGRAQLEQSLETLGYRVVLYPGLVGSGVDMTKPIAGVNPLINPLLPADDQRVTIDYKAGVVRLSCAPEFSGDFNPNNNLNGTTGRLQVFAVFWAYDKNLTSGTAQGLWVQRSDTANARTPARVYFNTTLPSLPTYTTHAMGWRMGMSDTPAHQAYVKALGGAFPVSSETEYPFLQPWERKSVEFGTIDDDSGFQYKGIRYLSYRPAMGWFLQGQLAEQSFRNLYGYQESERAIADKTALTISDASSPAQGFADVNPTNAYSFNNYGARSHYNLIRTQLTDALLKSSYGTVHFRKGTYYIQEAIPVPPGTTIEGEGPNTRFIYRNFDGTEGEARVKGLFKVGPNTTWGVYDVTATPNTAASYKTNLFPTQMSQATPGALIEGMDIVWNPVRRTWAMVFADVTSGTVMFNEFRVDGTSIFPGNGLNIKDNANPLFSQISANAEHHSGGHYPRIAFHQHSGEYVVVWVEEYNNAGFIGPQVHLRYLKLTVDQASAIGWQMTYPHGASITVNTSYTFADHPSVAIEDYTVGSFLYWAVVTCWSYADTVGGQINGSALNRRYYQNGVLTISHLTLLQAREVCSSTDVKADELGGFLSVFSVRSHRFLRGTNGTITPVVGPESYITDPSFNFSNENVVPGSKFFLLTSTASPFFNGIDCIVYDVLGGGGTQARIKDERGTALGADGPGVVWAMVPPVRIVGVRSHLSGVTQVEDSLVTLLRQDTDPASTYYHLEMREPDYVRLSRGAASWCVAFQGYNSVSWPAKIGATNYDFGFNTSPTSAGIALEDPNVYREHISTCALILRDDGNPTYPNTTVETIVGGLTGALALPAAGQFFARSMRDVEVSLKSLGTRPPLTERPNLQTLFSGNRVPYNATREVSFQNFSYRWMNDAAGNNKGVHACIPGITWTGQDWAIVSPAKPVIHCFTGNYQPDGFGDSYLSDVMFYFGEDAVGSDNNNWPLRWTLPSNSEIYLPSAATQVGITGVVDEHTVRISGEPLGPAPLTQVEWMLVVTDFPDTAGIKNQGFRINPEGRVLTSTSFTTWADEPDADDPAYWKREIELMRRPTLFGGNYPSQVAGGAVTESNDALEPGSRVKGDINFRGVAPGRPKGTNQYAAYQSPKIALAWGDNLYGLLDHVIEGGFVHYNRLEFYRQSFGPYNVTLRNFAIEASPTNALQVLSRAHVYTRHYAPIASNVSFDTDGFRNVFVYPASRVVTWYDPLLLPQLTSYVMAVYTDAKGQNPIKMQGPPLARGDADIWCSDVTEDVSASLADTDEVKRTFGQGTGPKVLWDGKRFVVVWIERSNRADLSALPGTMHGQGYQINLSYLPGSEDDGLQSLDLAYSDLSGALDTGLILYPLASATIEDGTGWALSDGQFATIIEFAKNTVAVCDIAFSGKVYAAVWTAGLAPDYGTTHTKGSALGVTIFGLDSAVPASMSIDLLTGGASYAGGGRTYIIEQFAEPGAFHNPKILWDGSQFVVFFEVTRPTSTATPPALFTAMAFALVPEDGLARPSEVKMTSAPGSYTGTVYDSGHPGTGAPYNTVPALGNGLGFGLTKEVLNPNFTAPYYGAQHTVVMLWGSSALMASHVTQGAGVTTAAATLNATIAAGNLITRGVRPGDVLVITGGADVGYFTIKAVTGPTTLTVLDELIIGAHTFTGEAVAQNFGIYRLQPVNVQAGDTLAVTKTVDTAGVVSMDSAGVYPILHFDPRTHRAVILGEFAGADLYWKGPKTGSGSFIHGEIRGGASSNYDTASIMGSGRSNISPRSYVLGNPQWASGAAVSEVYRLWGVTYNDVDDEFALLYTHGDNRTYFSRFKVNSRSMEPETGLYNVSSLFTAATGGDIAWNGANYLAVSAGFKVLPGPLRMVIRAVLLNRRGSVEKELDLESNLVHSGAGGFLFGNGLTQLPGPGYGSFPAYPVKVTGTVYPFAQQVKVRWNPRLSRWIVSASILWYDQEPVPLNPNVYPEYGVTESGVVILSWVGRTLTFTVASTIFQPGMKLALYNGIGGPLVAVVTIIELVGGGPTYSSVIVDSTAAQTDPTATAARVIIREDVLCWTLGQDARGLIIEDADNVMVENVTVGGGATDIEESWPNMARPTWQAAGQTFGQPTNVTFSSFASITKPPGYNHRFMTPEGKVNLPMYTNITSSGRNPYGRKRPPGAPVYRSTIRGKGER